jgi:hypothetical protein
MMSLETSQGNGRQFQPGSKRFHLHRHGIEPLHEFMKPRSVMEFSQLDSNGPPVDSLAIWPGFMNTRPVVIMFPNNHPLVEGPVVLIAHSCFWSSESLGV